MTVEVGTEKWDAAAILAAGDERQRLFDAQAADQPQFVEYAANAAKTGREIPVFRLVRN